MALCSMCYQARNTAPLYVGGPPAIQVASSVCRGCSMQVEKALNYISFRGFIVDLVRAPQLWSDAEDASLRGDGLGSGEITADAGTESAPAVSIPESNGAVEPSQHPPKTVAGRHPKVEGAGS